MEGFEDVEASLVADCQPAETAEPGQRALHDPAVPSQTLAALDAAPGEAIADPPPARCPPAARQIMGFVSVARAGRLAGLRRPVGERWPAGIMAGENRRGILE